MGLDETNNEAYGFEIRTKYPTGFGPIDEMWDWVTRGLELRLVEEKKKRLWCVRTVVPDGCRWAWKLGSLSVFTSVTCLEGGSNSSVRWSV